MALADPTAPCLIAGCIKPVFSRGWCATHYHRWNRYGDPLHVPHKTGTRARPPVAPLQEHRPHHPWNAQPGESPKAFAAFQIYLNLGPGRSFQAAWRQYVGRPDALAANVPGYFADWSRKNRWGDRARAWDIHAQELARVKMDAELAQEGQDLGRRRISAYKAILGVGSQLVIRASQDIALLSPDEARRLLPVATQMIQVAAAGIRVEFGANPGAALAGRTIAGVSVNVSPRGDVNITALMGDVARVLEEAGEPFDPLGTIPLMASALPPTIDVPLNLNERAHTNGKMPSDNVNGDAPA